MTADQLIQFVAGSGIGVAIAVYLVYQGSLRESRMAATLDEMQKFQQTELIEMHKTQSAALSQNTAALMQNTSMLKTVSDKIGKTAD